MALGELLFWIILGLFLLRAAAKLFGGIAEGMTGAPRQPGAGSAPPRGIHMARDPICGTYVVPERAISLSNGAERIYFCSTACRDKYQISKRTA